MQRFRDAETNCGNALFRGRFGRTELQIARQKKRDRRRHDRGDFVHYAEVGPAMRRNPELLTQLAFRTIQWQLIGVRPALDDLDYVAVRGKTGLNGEEQIAAIFDHDAARLRGYDEDVFARHPAGVDDPMDVYRNPRTAIQLASI